MLIRLNVGSALNPVTKQFDDSTKLRDVLGDIPTGSQVTLNGVVVPTADFGKTLKELNIGDDAHILYSTKQNSGRLGN